MIEASAVEISWILFSSDNVFGSLNILCYVVSPPLHTRCLSREVRYVGTDLLVQYLLPYYSMYNIVVPEGI